MHGIVLPPEAGDPSMWLRETRRPRLPFFFPHIPHKRRPPGQALTDKCPQDTLVYSCVCENNVSPNITQFSQTLPYYICTEWGTQCVNNCNNDNTCQDACRYVSCLNHRQS